MHPLFNPKEVWNEFLSRREDTSDRVSIFMGVPTMYINLLNEYDQSLTKNERMVEYVKATCSQKIRLMISGSAPLPSQVFDWWHMVTGHCILERYGMTEIGMALSNPLHGERKPDNFWSKMECSTLSNAFDMSIKIPTTLSPLSMDSIIGSKNEIAADKTDFPRRNPCWFVGLPMPSVRVRIVKQNELPGSKEEVLAEGDCMKTRNFSNDSSVSGLLQVKGAGVFKQYWNKPEATASEFTEDGWFRTG
ncbi:Acyl-CoA synthetase member 3, mitochondrial, variant 2 [Homalodisca vitripennis]|nr:Acyl-CoA synthetase member 3, mitochondrial, variant 2 [Homalodisca vitripennis]